MSNPSNTPPSAGDTRQADLFVSLLAAVERRLASFILTIVPNFADADEILQETKLRLWKQFEEYDESKSFDAWARSVAYYQVLTYRKRKGREKVFYSSKLLVILAEDYSKQADNIGSYADKLQECLKLLNQKYQDLLQNFYGGSSSVEQIAKLFGMTVVAIRKALYRSRMSLHDCILRRMRAEEEASL